MANRITAFITKTLVVIMASCALFSFAANAAEDSGLLTMKKPNMFTSEYKPYVGILAGMTAPEGRGDDQGEVGIDIGYSPTKENLMLGAEYSHAQFDDVAANDEIDRDTLLIKAGYKFSSDNMFVRNSWVALGVGALFTDDDTVAVAAPMVGFDIPVTSTDTEYLTLGLNARYSFVEADAIDTGTVAGAVKYWY